MSAWHEANKKYPFIAFNDHPGGRNKNNILFAVEGYNIKPTNFDPKVVTQYGGYITTNKKMYDNFKPVFGEKCWYLRGCIRWDDIHHDFNEFIDYNNKINGICMIHRSRVNNNEGDISSLRERVMINLSNSELQVDCYGKVLYNGKLYKGPVGNNPNEQSPSTVQKLRKLSEYKYNLCFENVYNEVHSWDMITEKIIDCFRAKTVAVYYGCYNIEDFIPTDLFIDYRQFNNDKELAQYILDMSESQYNNMVNNAHDFVQSINFGRVEDFHTLVTEVGI